VHIELPHAASQKRKAATLPVVAAQEPNHMSNVYELRSKNASFDLDSLRNLSGGAGIVDVPCPACGPSRRTPSNRVRPVLRIWDDGDFISYNCARCGEAGWVKDNNAGRSEPRRRVEPAKPAEPASDKSDIARLLWERSKPAKGSLVEDYLRSRGCWIDSPSIRFLPARGEHFAAAISRFGIGGQVAGVHLTRFHSDRIGNAGKIMLGKSMGEPIVVYDNPERLELAITEGIEDALSMATATGWSAWAAGSAARVASVVPLARSFDEVFVVVDNDNAGHQALERAKKVRPDIRPLSFGDLDANDTIQQHGADAILKAIDDSFVAASMREAA
jgi:hypothetical protein